MRVNHRNLVVGLQLCSTCNVYNVLYKWQLYYRQDKGTWGRKPSHCLRSINLAPLVAEGAWAMQAHAPNTPNENQAKETAGKAPKNSLAGLDCTPTIRTYYHCCRQVAKMHATSLRVRLKLG